MNKKEKYFQIIAENMLNLGLNNTFEDQFPIDIIQIDKNITNNITIELIESFLKNLKNESLYLSNIILFLLNRDFNSNIKSILFKQSIDKLIDLRKDFSLETSLDLNYYLKIDSEILENLNHRTPIFEKKEYSQLIFLLDNLFEIICPVYRGWVYDIYTKNNLLYRKYHFKDKILLLLSELERSPKLDFFGHVLAPEKIKRFWLFEIKGNNYNELNGLDLKNYILSKYPKIEFQNKSDRFYFVLNQWKYFFDLLGPIPRFEENSFINNIPRQIPKDMYSKIIISNIKYYNDLYG